MLSYEETANELIQISLQLQELWVYNPDNPEHKDVKEEFDKLLIRKNAIEEYLSKLENQDEK